jgi:hypothetical protein
MLTSDQHIYFKTNTATYDLTDMGMTNPMTTSQDLIIGGASGTPARLAKGANGTYLGVDGSGNLAYATPSSSPVAVGCRATQSTGTSMPDTTQTQLAFDGTDHDTDTLFDNANDRINLDRNGLWLVQANVRVDGISDGGRCFLMVRHYNGTSYKRVCFDDRALGAVSSYWSANVAAVVQRANAGEYVQADAYQTSGATKSSSTSDTWLSATFLGS